MGSVFILFVFLMALIPLLLRFPLEFQGDYHKAEALLKRSLHLNKRKRYANGPIISSCLHNLGVLCWRKVNKVDVKSEGNAIDRGGKYTSKIFIEKKVCYSFLTK